MIQNGAEQIVRHFSGTPQDLAFIESGGKLPFDRPEIISSRAFERGDSQLGSLGSGNHFIEIQEVEEIYDPHAAEVFGLRLGMAVIMIHTGSRGFGHQVACDYIETCRKKHLPRMKVQRPAAGVRRHPFARGPATTCRRSTPLPISPGPTAS